MQFLTDQKIFRLIFYKCATFLILIAATISYANSDLPLKYLVLGVIADTRPQKGVVLLKAESTSKTFAVRSGEAIDADLYLDTVNRDYVVFKSKEKTFKIKVGEFVDPSKPGFQESHQDIPIQAGIERVGNLVKISSSLREYVAGPSLSKILMQAAAVPQYIDGELRGFGLFEIEQDSVFEKAGFVNGDVIMNINGQNLSNVGQAIKVLHSLKTENNVEVLLLRGGVEQKIHFQIN